MGLWLVRHARRPSGVFLGETIARGVGRTGIGLRRISDESRRRRGSENRIVAGGRTREGGGVARRRGSDGDRPRRREVATTPLPRKGVVASSSLEGRRPPGRTRGDSAGAGTAGETRTGPGDAAAAARMFRGGETRETARGCSAEARRRCGRPQRDVGKRVAFP
mmetsp:Transcript_31108/g.96265  ORF Transcript_31108/g.96265 Transcript_31108/m.96265 type:complete len:164 (+) Transcript_31108:330-821(+)